MCLLFACEVGVGGIQHLSMCGWGKGGINLSSPADSGFVETPTLITLIRLASLAAGKLALTSTGM